MKRNGRTKAGTQRWRCGACGASATHGNDVSGRELAAFVAWLLSKETQVSMPGAGRTFRRRAERFWKIWPMPPVVDEVHRVVFVDGIYLDPGLTAEGPLPATNNMIEGGVNAQLREVLRNHRGLKVDRRIKAVYWWCYMHSELSAPFSEILATMPTDDDIDVLRDLYSGNPVPSMDPVEWGNGLTWSEFHHGTAYPYSIE